MAQEQERPQLNQQGNGGNGQDPSQRLPESLHEGPDVDRASKSSGMVSKMHHSRPQRESYLMLRRHEGQSWFELRAVCGKHRLCSYTKSCRLKRPIGLLWAWLDAADRCEDKTAHDALKSGAVLDVETRISARLRFGTFDGSAAWFDAEAPGEGEPDMID